MPHLVLVDDMRDWMQGLEWAAIAAHLRKWAYSPGGWCLQPGALGDLLLVVVQEQW